MSDELDPHAKLMLRFKDGDEASFIELVNLYKQRVFAFAFRFLGNAEDAEDAAQEVFIKVYNAKDKYAPKAKFSTWLFTIARNTCLNLLERGAGKACSFRWKRRPDRTKMPRRCR